jgi:3'-phosphoadenosine 5'-phosphosulfate sulfotransferase
MNLEIVTLVLSIIGEMVSMWGLLSCIADLNYLTALNLNGARRIVAVQNISRQAFRMLLQMVVVAVGILSTTFPDQSSIMLAFFILISVIITISEVNDRLRRMQLEHLYDQMEGVRAGRRKTDATLAAVCDELKDTK